MVIDNVRTFTKMNCFLIEFSSENKINNVNTSNST